MTASRWCTPTRSPPRTSFSHQARTSFRLARRQIAAYAEARKRGEGVAVVDGRIVENLHVAIAEALIARAEAIAAMAE